MEDGKIDKKENIRIEHEDSKTYKKDDPEEDEQKQQKQQQQQNNEAKEDEDQEEDQEKKEEDQEEDKEEDQEGKENEGEKEGEEIDEEKKECLIVGQHQKENSAEKKIKNVPTPGKKKKKSVVGVKPMSKKSLKKFKAAEDRTGVIYLSSIPPFMQLTKVRHLFKQYGRINRIYLTPEDKSVNRSRRKKNVKGYKNRKFIDGWIEFLDKKIAKRVARALNNTIIGGPKGNHWRDFIWNIRYLRGCKWRDLTERIAHRAAVIEDTIRTEMSKVKKQGNFYMKQVQHARRLEAMENRREKKRQLGKNVSVKSQPKKRRKFHQREPINVDTI